MSLAILCPGQGSQNPAMLDVITGNAAAEEVLDNGAQTLGTHVREWLAKPDQLDINAVAQPLLCLTCLATWAALRDELETPLAIAGYSVGEVASYAVAGALDAGELAGLARTRAALMDEASTVQGGLVALRGLRRAEVQAMCAGSSAWIAIANGDDAFVVGGDMASLDALAERAAARGAQITCLKVGVASHTPLLQSAANSFRNVLDASALQSPAVPVVAGIDASLVTSRARAVATLAAQIGTTIEWARCLHTLYERGARVFLELGPGSALSRMVREQLPSDVAARSVSEFRSLGGVQSWLKRVAR